jgi:DNA-binding XRE family transcriptional regulator
MRSKRGTLSGVNQPRQTARTRAVTGSRFRTARAACCLGLPEAAKLFRVTPRTIQNWETGRVRVPYAAFKLMRVLRGHDLPHPAWKGFRLVGNTLWTPEGHPFRPDHMAWWSLTCRMADSFRALVSRPGLVIASGAGEVSAREASAEPPIPRSPVVQIADTPPSEGVLMVRAVPRSAEGGTPYSNHGVRTFRVTESPVCVGGAA